ncbi:efflux RND transporter periplasmic adaptor subunit [Bordetella genomosp. 12]|uniref:Secretion protein HylD n=1 Tax=Bordetella genomosp. 12 TaxID=463035 RepID=A0A261VC60_9BORD|nr:HlyD family efflux transporter periplasmic adaptor subunit [Bordetella genomosp. 12]OZI71595.1 secretion protein HylD [Bordetella genomosp. 12]
MTASNPAQDAAQQVRLDGRQLALLWQLSARARAAASEATLGFTVVNETLALTPYRQAAWWRGDGSGQVAAVSGLPQSDPNAPYVQWLSSLCKTLIRARPAAKADPAAAQVAGQHAPVLPPRAQIRLFTAEELRSEAPLLADEWSAWWPAHGAWLPLADRSGRTLGAVVFARDQPWTAVDTVLLTELGQVWAHAFQAFAPRASWRARAGSLLRPGRQQRRVLLAMLVVCLIPVRLTVLAPAEVTPQDPFVVRSPLDGVITELHVQPNQPVQAGTPLFSLDATTLQSRHALASKNFDTAQQEYRQTAQMAVTDDRTRLDMIDRQGKLDQSRVELDYSARQLARVNVNAPHAAVAVFSDPNEWTGKAVAVGEKVLVLADPARVQLTAWLPVADNIDVQPGTPVTLYPKSSPLASYDARIESIAWKAEPTPDGVLAYRVRASLQAGAAQPPLGAMGTARIQGPWVPAIYYALRRPLTQVRQWLGW